MNLSLTHCFVTVTDQEELVDQGALSGVLFKTDDVDAFFEKVRASGAEVMQEPTDQPYGVRDCAFRDPSGNQVRIAGPTA